MSLEPFPAPLQGDPLLGFLPVDDSVTRRRLGAQCGGPLSGSVVLGTASAIESLIPEPVIHP
jgi:hypothetical protein